MRYESCLRYICLLSLCVTFVMLSGCLFQENKCQEYDKIGYKQCKAFLESGFNPDMAIRNRFFEASAFSEEKDDMLICNRIYIALNNSAGNFSCPEAEKIMVLSNKLFHKVSSAVENLFSSVKIDYVSEETKEWFNRERDYFIAKAKSCSDFNCSYAVLEHASILYEFFYGEPQRIYEMNDTGLKKYIVDYTLSRKKTIEKELEEKQELLKKTVEQHKNFKDAKTIDDFRNIVSGIEKDIEIEKKRKPGLYKSYILLETIVFVIITSTAVMLYKKRYDEQVEFWKTYTSTTTFISPVYVVIAIICLSILLCITGAALLSFI